MIKIIGMGITIMKTMMVIIKKIMVKIAIIANTIRRIIAIRTVIMILTMLTAIMIISMILTIFMISRMLKAIFRLVKNNNKTTGIIITSRTQQSFYLFIFIFLSRRKRTRKRRRQI